MTNFTLYQTKGNQQIFIRSSDVHRRKCVDLLNKAVDKMLEAREILVAKKRSTNRLDARIGLAKSEIRNHLSNMGTGFTKTLINK